MMRKRKGGQDGSAASPTGFFTGAGEGDNEAEMSKREETRIKMKKNRLIGFDVGF